MKHKTWFRLVLKAIGLLLIGLSLPGMSHLLFSLATWCAAWLGWEVDTNQFMFWNISYTIGYCSQFLFGMYLLLGGKFIINRCIPSNRAYCPECGYQLANAQNDRCPECGTTLPPLTSNLSQF